ncbi:ATP-binding protein [Streptomyces sp. E11-3]|uniref:ATP-binding protein n=1 Tax=Streptomyces sp. E11-3 TaxID=3110112 RepID=UPI00397EA3BC
MPSDDDQPRVPHCPTQLTYEYSLFAPAGATCPKVCRDFVRGVLTTLGREPLVLPATLCTSELVTNVHLHTKGSAMLRLWLTPARFRLTVFDECPDLPVTPCPAVATCWGRGLTLVGEVADRWGVADGRAGRYAKGVWFELGRAVGGGGGESFRPHRIG